MTRTPQETGKEKRLNTYALISHTGKVVKFVHSDSYPGLSEEDCETISDVLLIEGVELQTMEEVQKAVKEIIRTKWWAKE
jgi:CRISPR/Cas system type I-B associated protein Csh2 (Cas7 group RAMP superfamily)